jgi:MGT family glycosyltransferase
LIGIAVAKALFLSLPLSGHINPSLPLVQELVARGDDVVYYATAAFAPAIERTGAQYRPYRNAFLADLKGLPEHLNALSWLFMRTTAELFEEHLDEFRALQPGYVITDAVAPWGQWIAEALHVPAVTSVPTFAYNRQVLAFAARSGVTPRSFRSALSKLRNVAKALRLGRVLQRRYHVKGPGIGGLVMSRSDLSIVYTSRHFQPCAETFDNRFEFVGPSMAARAGATDFPWDQIRQRVVYVSLGTLFNADARFYRDCFQAFEGQDLQVVLSRGANLPRESLGTAPDNFIVQAQVPQLEVLQRTSAFVTHGGMNSVCESLYYGVPLLVVPQMSEQAIIGRRVEQLGAGLYLAKESVTAERLRESVQRLLREDAFRRQAGRVRESFLKAGGVSRAADAIRRFVG